MSLKLLTLIMDVDRAVIASPRPLADAAPAVFETIASVFAPRTLWVQVDGGDVFQLEALGVGSVGQQRLWREESVVPGQPLTRCTPGPATALVAELRQRLVGRTVSSLFIGAEGALRHHAPSSPVPAWSGRWVINEGLLELVSVRLQWTADLRAFELSFPHSGYPLTSSRLALDGSLADGEATVAAANRATIVPALAGVRDALGLTAAQVRWHDDGDYAALFRDDAEDLRQVWLPRLHGVARDRDDASAR